MSAFQKRVALLEKWVPSLLPQLKNIDDMAEIILDVWDEAEAHTEERIAQLLRGHQPENSSASDFVGCDCGNYEEWYAEHIITLIKGENK